MSDTLGDSHIHTLKELFFVLSLVRGDVFLLVFKSVVQKEVTSGFLDFADTFTTLIAHFGRNNSVFVDEGLELLLAFSIKFIDSLQIGLGEDNNDWLVGEQSLNSCVKGNLLVNRVTTGFRGIDEEQDTGLQVSQGSDGLHFDVVHLVQGLIQDTRGVDNLPSDVVVISVTDEQGLGCEGIRLNIDIGVGDLVDETGFTDVGETSDEEGTGVRVDVGHSGKMLSDFLEETERRSESLDDLGHSSQTSSLEHLASVQTVTVLKESDVVLSDVVNQVTGSVNMSQCDFVMILVVDNVDKISIEGVDVVELGEVVKDFSELLMDILTAELDLSHVERSDSGDVVAGMDDSGGLSLSFGKDDVDKVSGGGDDLDLLEVIIHVL